MNDIMPKRRYEPPSPAPEVQAKLDMAARETINVKSDVPDADLL